MNLYGIGKDISYTASIMGVLLALTSLEGNAGTMGPAMTVSPGKVYFGVFGGGGASDNVNISQYGTAFFTEAVGGPLAVNAFGKSDSRSMGLVGGHVGYQWMNFSSTLFDSQLTLEPAFELEGYYLGRSSFTAHEINNDTTRLSEHDFLVEYPTSTGVFLTNAILNFTPSQSRFHPYLGVGIGAAVISIKNASAIQVAPPEVGVNHYNANTSNTTTTFAAQGKIGLAYDLSSNFNVFVEYRGLYLADSNYAFGSTVYPGHAPTSSWRVDMDSQYFNLGAIGIHYTI